jgi:hypothetical protein
LITESYGSLLDGFLNEAGLKPSGQIGKPAFLEHARLALGL